MKLTLSQRYRNRRRGIIAVLSAALFVVALAMCAFAVDLGYMAMVKSQLQVAADSAALAAAGSSNLTSTQMRTVAKGFAGYHMTGNSAAVVNDSDIVFGTWDPSKPVGQRFSMLESGLGTAVQVTAHANNVPLFFGRMFGTSSKNFAASAVAAVNPRDIAFVVDLSSSMNDDTVPGSSTTSHDNLIQAVYNDLFGLNGSNSPNVTYDPSESTQSVSGYNYTIAQKMTSLLTKFPHVVPTPNTAVPASVQYWTDYFGIKGTNFSYKTYANFLMTYGRTEPIGGTSRFSIMSIKNPSYRQHSETVGGVTYSGFPASEMPTHALRRAIIAALQVIQERNNTIDDPDYKDRVSIIAFDRKNSGSDTDNVVVLNSLTSNYASVMNTAITLQACGGSGVCTDSEGGIKLARDHIKPISEGGAGRENANKIIIFLTDGNANLYESPDNVINQYKQANPGGWDDDYASNAALMQASTAQGKNWYLYAVGMGLGANQGFMNKMAVKGGTAKDGASYDNASDSSVYEETLRSIFRSIVTNPKLRLVE
jgi:hypothetical protein